MRKFLRFHDQDHPDDCAELSPIAFDEFSKIGCWTGANDTAFRQFLRHNRFWELDHFSEETLQHSTIEMVAGEPTIDWTILYGEHDGDACETCQVFRYKRWSEVSRFRIKKNEDQALLVRERDALLFAAERHGNQAYGDQPYLVHLVAVHKIAVDFKLSDDVRVAAYLHDVLEDTPATYQELSRLFGHRVADLVEAVTGRGENRKARLSDAFKKIAAAGPEAVKLKLCDRLANARASRHTAFALSYGRDDRLFEMYRKEFLGFLSAMTMAMELTTEDPIYRAMMRELQEVLSAPR